MYAKPLYFNVKLESIMEIVKFKTKMLQRQTPKRYWYKNYKTLCQLLVKKEKNGKKSSPFSNKFKSKTFLLHTLSSPYINILGLLILHYTLWRDLEIQKHRAVHITSTLTTTAILWFWRNLPKRTDVWQQNQDLKLYYAHILYIYNFGSNSLSSQFDIWGSVEWSYHEALLTPLISKEHPLASEERWRQREVRFNICILINRYIWYKTLNFKK